TTVTGAVTRGDWTLIFASSSSAFRSLLRFGGGCFLGPVNTGGSPATPFWARTAREPAIVPATTARAMARMIAERVRTRSERMRSSVPALRLPLLQMYLRLVALRRVDASCLMRARGVPLCAVRRSTAVVAHRAIFEYLPRMDRMPGKLLAMLLAGAGALSGQGRMAGPRFA